MRTASSFQVCDAAAVELALTACAMFAYKDHSCWSVPLLVLIQQMVFPSCACERLPTTPLPYAQHLGESLAGMMRAPCFAV
jgi:hypothetical protein